MKSAYETIQDVYDIETLREIRDHGCVSGVAHDHIYYYDTVKFFDEYEDEIVEYIADTLGGEFNDELWSNNPCNITGYKNDTTWCYIELVAGQLIDEYENTTCEELSESDEYTIDPDGEVVFKADLEDGNVHDVTNAIGMNSLSNNTYEDIKELASTPWGQDHLEIISA